MTNNVRFTLSVHCGLQLVLSKTYRSGDTKFNLWCSLSGYLL